jgi:DNA primase
VIGFGGRVMGAGEPKYLNSPETPVFSKGRELYGLYLARNAIRDAGRVVVVEGYMDVVALAQHGVEYAVATLGTATTPTHVQKLFRLTDTVVFCFDGDNAGRKAAWRALENTLPVLADGKNAVFLFLPDGEDPDDFVRKRGRAAFEKAQESAVPLSEFLLADLAARHPPTSAEGRAALVAAARPHMAEIHAPVLAAILRRRLSELSGLPESELRGLLNLPAPPGAPGTAPRATRDENRQGQRGAGFRANVRRPPSLTRELIRGLLLSPALARSLEFPRPDDGSPDSAALVALVDHCAAAEGETTTAGILQHFADTPHAAVLAGVLATADDHGLTVELAEGHLREGLERWWQQARRSGSAAPAPVEGGQTAEEIQRLRQLQFVRKTAGEAPGSTPSEDSF